MKILGSLISAVWTIFKWMLIPIGVFFAVVGVVCFFYFGLDFLKGNRLQKGQHNTVKRKGFFYNLFYAFPKRFSADLFARNPEFFSHQGCICFTGRQGKGKTIAMVEQAMQWQHEYPKALEIDNLGYRYQNERLSDWRQLIDYKNGIYGVIVMMDEMQNWFSSNQSKNFPPEMLQVITQNRKNRRVIMGTSQCFNRLSKPIREQATEERKCCTLFGCITFVHRVEPILDSTGEVIERKHRGFYWFVHSDKLRDAYDTYKVIESLRESGFQDAPAITEIKNFVAK